MQVVSLKVYSQLKNGINDHLNTLFANINNLLPEVSIMYLILGET